MAIIGWRIFAVALAAYVISILVSPYDFSDIGSLLQRISLSIIWVVAAIGLVFYAFDISKGSSNIWTVTKYAWLGLGCVNFYYGWETLKSELTSGTVILAIISSLIIIFANYVALQRLSNET